MQRSSDYRCNMLQLLETRSLLEKLSIWEDENDFYVDTDDEGEQLESNVMFMARLEKMEAFEAEHADSDQDRLIHATTLVFCLMAHIDTSSLDPTWDNSQVHHESIDPNHSAMLQSYALLQAEKDKNAYLENKIHDMLYEEKSERPLALKHEIMELKPDTFGLK
ncbi:hypothetical protein Tco_1468299 [Tanacetum coccineum]